MRRRLFPNMIGDVAELEERQERMERVMQILGITPEYPYTVNINDGTRNRVMLGLVDGDYGIKIVDNAGNEILLANGTIIANAIKSGTLDCSLITVANLDAGSITVGYLSASKIQGGTLNCSLMTVSNLNAGSITVGSFSSPNDRFTDESLNGVKISQNTISGNRIVANSINADRIQAGTITADRITAKTITADRIQDYSLGTGQLIYNGVSGDRIQDVTITNAKISNVSADKLTAGTLYVGYSGRPVAMYIGTGSSGDAKFYFQGGSRMWADSSNRIGINSLGSPMYIYCNSSEQIIIPSSGQITLRGGAYLGSSGSAGSGNLNANGNIRCNNVYFSQNGSEGSIYDIDMIRGYNDLRSYVNGGDKAIWYSTSGGGDISFFPYWGDIYKTGSVSFKIPHPEDPDNKWLQYVSIEAPEVALKIRGVAMLNNGEVVITPPHHWELATEEYLTTVQLTPLEDCNGLYAPKSSLSNTQFTVKELQGGTSNAEFMWELTATRKGKSEFNPEPTIEAEADKTVDALIEEDKKTLKQLEDKVKAHKVKADSFRELVLTKYKDKTGKDYVSKIKKAHEDKKEAEEAQHVALVEETSVELKEQMKNEVDMFDDKGGDLDES